MFASTRTAATLFVLQLAVTILSGQVATGSYPYGTYDNRGFDTINVGNLNVHFAVPVLTKAGRGIPLEYNLAYDSSIWTPTTVGGVTSWVPVTGFGWNGVPTFGHLTATETTQTIVVGVPPHQETCHVTSWNNWTYVDAHGAQHYFGGMTENETGSCTTDYPSFSAVATDGSGLTLSITNYTVGTVTLPSGFQFSPPYGTSGAATAFDTNGNYISTDVNGNVTDTTGVQVLTVAGSPSTTQTLTYKDETGTARSVSVNYAAYTVQTAFGCSGVAEYGPTATYLVHTITYPDSSTYTFNYEATPGVPANVTGRIASVELPQGGAIQYSYAGAGSNGSNGIECADGSTSVLTRTISADSGSAASTWTYTRTSPGGAGTSQTAVEDGLSNNMVYNFVEASNQPAWGTAVYYETSRSIYNGAATGTPVIARNTC